MTDQPDLTRFTIEADHLRMTIVRTICAVAAFAIAEPSRVMAMMDHRLEYSCQLSARDSLGRRDPFPKLTRLVVDQKRQMFAFSASDGETWTFLNSDKGWPGSIRADVMDLAGGEGIQFMSRIWSVQGMGNLNAKTGILTWVSDDAGAYAITAYQCALQLGEPPEIAVPTFAK